MPRQNTITQMEKYDKEPHQKMRELSGIAEQDLLFATVVCCDTLKCISDLLLKISNTSVWSFSTQGIKISARDTTSYAKNEIWAVLGYNSQCSLETTVVDVDTSDLQGLCKQLRKRDMVRLYLTTKHCLGLLTEYSSYTKNATVKVTLSSTTPERPVLLCAEEVAIKSTLFQRMVREYKNSCKRITISGNGSFCLFQADNENSLNRTDKLQTPFFFPF